MYVVCCMFYVCMYVVVKLDGQDQESANFSSAMPICVNFEAVFLHQRDITSSINERTQIRHRRTSYYMLFEMLDNIILS